MNVSVKPTALATHYEPLTGEVGLAGAKERLRPILRLARERGAFVNVDMEHYDAKDLTLRLFRELLSEDEFADMPAGIVVQAYLRDSHDDLADLIAWSARRAEPITVRLVKGPTGTPRPCTPGPRAGRSRSSSTRPRPMPTTSAACACCTTTTARCGPPSAPTTCASLAYAITYARHQGIPDTGYEIQMLHGMAEPMHAAMRRLGLRLRVYAPVGELVPGMAYLVRRLLENTSNESFVRHRFAEGRALDELLPPPEVDELRRPPARAAPTDPVDPSPYRPEPVSEWRRPSARAAMAAAVAAVDGELGGHGPGADRRRAGADRGRRWPPSTRSDPVVVVPAPSPAGVAEADAAVAAPSRRRGVAPHAAAERAAVLFRAADLDAARRQAIAALEVRRGGQAVGPVRRRRVRGDRLL